MTKKLLTPVSLLFLVFSAVAQPQPVASLTIFSEDGDKFFLILNGERQNNVAQTNLRVEDLPQLYYNAKVIFEDKTLGEISKNALYVADVNGIMQDVTYKIHHNKNNDKMTLKFFSMVAVQQNYIPPSNVTVIRYGIPATIVTQTTTTQSVGNTTGANLNVGGLNMNVTVTDPLLTGTVQTTTTHTTTSGNQSTTIVEHPVIVEHQGEGDHHGEHHVGCKGSYPMSSGNFSSALNTIKNEGFDETRLTTAKQIATGNCLSAGQVSEICQIFGFEQTKLDFAKFAYDHCTEPQNYFKVNNVFGFSSSSDELNQYIQNHH